MTMKTTWGIMMMTRRRKWKRSCVSQSSCTDFQLHDVQEVDEGDLRTLDALLPSNAGERRTLADIIFSKLEGANEEEKTTTIQKTQRGQ